MGGGSGGGRGWMGEDRGGDEWGGWQGYRVGGCYKLTLHVIKEDKMKNIMKRCLPKYC